MVERRSVAPDGVGSSPTTHPNKLFITNSLKVILGVCPTRTELSIQPEFRVG